MPQCDTLAGAFNQHCDFFRGTWAGSGRFLGQPHNYIAVAEAAPGEFARRGEHLADTRFVVARPAKAARPIGFHSLAVPTFHRAPLSKLESRMQLRINIHNKAPLSTDYTT